MALGAMLVAMFLRLLGTGVALGSLICGGCAGSTDTATNAKGPLPEPSGTKSAQKTVVTQQLELLSDSPLRLGFGEQAQLQARLTDADGAPVSDTKVSFALIGRAQDSSLAGLDASTDQDGVVQNGLIAGQMAATFRVRISAPSALDTFADVAVSNAGFGTLAVTAAYAGRRTIAQRVVFAQANMTCMQAGRMQGDPTATLGNKGNVVHFLALPAEVSYAVTALAEGTTGGTLVAQGCVDGVRVTADSETTTSVDFTDQPLELAGQFMLEAELDSSAPAAVLGAALGSASETLIKTDAQGQSVPVDAEGRFLLDSLDGTLHGGTYAKQSKLVSLSSALSQARTASATMGTLEHSLQALLVVNGEGPLSTIPRIVELTDKSLATTRLFAQLTLNANNAKHPLSWQTQRIEALPLADGATAPMVDLSALQDMTDTQASFAPKQDTLALSSVRFRGQLGALAAQVLTKVVSSDKAGHGDEIRALVGCATLGEWLSKQSLSQHAACDTSCVQAACDRAVARLTGAAQTALLALDDKRPTLTLRGQLELGDDNGDLIPDRMTGDTFSGQWDAEPAVGQGDAVSGPTNATALAQPPP